MEGIPPARASDNEEVRWALETAESLWKRNARVDAIVWLRRAAQEASQSGDDDRASGLMVEAATLTDAISRASAHARAALPANPSSVPPPSAQDDIDALLAGSEDEPPTAKRAALVRSEPPKVAKGEPPKSLDLVVDEETLDEDDLEEVDSGDLVSLAPRTPIPTGEPSKRVPTDEAPSSAVPTPVVDDDERSSAVPTPVVHQERVTRPPENVPPDPAGITRMGEGALSSMDLVGVAAFRRLADEARDRLVRSAVVILCTADIEVPEFAIALVLEGQVTAFADDGSTIAQFGHGEVLRTRGTLEAALPARFAATLDDTTLALWSEASLGRAFGEAALVASALRSDGDRLQAWAHVTASPLASRLHEEVRLRLVSRLTTTALLPGAELVRGGELVPGLLLVAVGKVTIDGPAIDVVGPGNFVFAGATLAAGRAAATARAGDDGAIILCADRRTTQELIVTEPLLLELLATEC